MVVSIFFRHHRIRHGSCLRLNFRCCRCHRLCCIRLRYCCCSLMSGSGSVHFLILMKVSRQFLCPGCLNCCFLWCMLKNRFLQLRCVTKQQVFCMWSDCRILPDSCLQLPDFLQIPLCSVLIQLFWQQMCRLKILMQSHCCVIRSFLRLFRVRCCCSSRLLFLQWSFLCR